MMLRPTPPTDLILHSTLMTPVSRWMIALGLAILTGCSASKDTILPQDGPTIRALYDRHQRDGTARSPRIGEAIPPNRDAQPVTPLPDDVGTDVGWPTDPMRRGPGSFHRTARNEIDGLFPRLPNPTLLMYVFAHLDEESGLPVPGYTTAFPMYREGEYALPGEARWRPSDAAAD